MNAAGATAALWGPVPPGVLEAPGASHRVFLKKYHCSAAIERTDNSGVKIFAYPGYLINGEISKLVDHGYAPGEIKMGADQTAQFWMKDPNGLDVEFQQYNEKSSQRTGQDVEVNW